MKNLTRWSIFALAVGALSFSGCTARYKQLLFERDREIAALKDEASHLQAESRTLRSSEDALKKRLKLVKDENNRLKQDLNERREVSVSRGNSQRSVADAELENLARKNGLRLDERPEGIAVVLPNSVTFRSGSASLTSKGKAILNTLAGMVTRKFASRKLSIEGHTDSQPIKKSKFGTNWRLSAERAESVRNYLFTKGCRKVSKVRVVGYGSTEPIASNRKESGRKQNRRVELVILDG